MIVSFVATCVALSLGACSGYGYDETSGEYYGDGDFSQDAGTNAGIDTTSAPPVEPEPEEPPPPALSARYVFVASPDAGVVARIDATTLAVVPVRVGRRPEVVVADRNSNRAVALNSGSDTVSVLEGLSREATDTISIIRGCNALRLSPDGRWLAAWFDASADRLSRVAGSLQEVALVDTESREAHVVSVGFDIGDVRFSDASDRLVAVTADGVSVVVLDEVDGDVLADVVRYDSLPGEVAREVVLSPSARWAVVSTVDGRSVQILDTVSLSSRTVELSGVATDVDIDEPAGRVLAAQRDSDSIDVIPLAIGDGLPRTIAVSSAPAGILTQLPDGERAFYFSPASGSHLVGMIDLQSGVESDAFRFQKSVVDIRTTQDSGAAIVVHPSESSEGRVAGVDVRTATQPGFSVLDLETGYAKLVLLPQPVRDIVISNDQESFFVLHDTATGSTVEWIDRGSFARRELVFDEHVESIGWMEEGERLFVLGSSAGGQLWFIDQATGQRQSVTSFVLNAYTE
jgi:DNA-binding beta-propeller fold protein YncE